MASLVSMALIADYGTLKITSKQNTISQIITLLGYTILLVAGITLRLLAPFKRNKSKGETVWL